jgi:hypothetical protein
MSNTIERSTSRFTTSARPRDVDAHFHDQMTRDGWRRASLEIGDERSRAE